MVSPIAIPMGQHSSDGLLYIMLHVVFFTTRKSAKYFGILYRKMVPNKENMQYLNFDRFFTHDNGLPLDEVLTRYSLISSTYSTVFLFFHRNQFQSMKEPYNMHQIDFHGFLFNSG